MYNEQEQAHADELEELQAEIEKLRTENKRLSEYIADLLLDNPQDDEPLEVPDGGDTDDPTDV